MADRLDDEHFANLQLYGPSTYGIALGRVGREMAALGLVEWLPGPSWGGTIYGITEKGKQACAAALASTHPTNIDALPIAAGRDAREGRDA